MDNSTCSTLELLGAIYTLEHIKPSASSPKKEPHLLFESTRRFLDITRHIYRRWPYSTPYIFAFDQGHTLTQVFEQFPLRARHYNNIAQGAHALFKRAVARLSTPFYAELLEYEDAQSAHTPNGTIYTTEQPNKGDYLTLPYDLESFYISLLFYGRASAPAFLYLQLAPEPGITYKILSP